MKKHKTIKSILNTTCRLMPSKIEGVGVFAIRDIEEGVNPFEDEEPTKWVKIKNSDLEGATQEVKRLLKGFFVEEGKHVWVTKHGFYSMGLSTYTNHSKNANLRAVDTKNGTVFFTKRKILKGEELLSDYSEFEEEQHEYMK